VSRHGCLCEIRRIDPDIVFATVVVQDAAMAAQMPL
jgi:hypothetical protein